jgi:predicted transcriptional regulator
MARPSGNRKEARLSVSLDSQTYAQLCALARRSDVSAAWMIRRAINELIQRSAHPDETLELPLPPRQFARHAS